MGNKKTKPAWWFGTMEFDDFPFSNVIIPTDELHYFSDGWLNHQPDS
jgi:hypothetical protein